MVKESLNSNRSVDNSYSSKPPMSGRNSGGDAGWDSFDDDGGANNIRRNNTVGDFRSSGSGGSAASRAKSTQNIYSKAELEASAANKEDFFSRMINENQSKPEGVHPSQGGKHVGF